MDVLIVRPDGSEQLIASGLSAGEVGELEDWWRYTKPFGPDIKIVVRPNLHRSTGLRTTGTEGDSLRHSKVLFR